MLARYLSAPAKRALLFILGVSTLVVPACASTSDGSADNSASATLGQWRRHRHEEVTGYDADARQRYPWFVSLGAYFPTFTGDGTSNSTGAEFAVGFRFVSEGMDFRVSGRGQEFNITDNSGTQSTIDVSELSFDALFRSDQLYGGPGISFGSVTGTTAGFTVSGTSQAVLSLTLGFDLSPRTFIEARWQTANVDAYKGISVNFGFRF